MNQAAKNPVEVYIVDLSTKMIRSVRGELLIGRCDGGLQFPCDPEMSRRHLRIVLMNELVMVEDLGSTNGTKVNGQFIKQYAPNQVNNGDVIEVGGQRLMIHVQDAGSDALAGKTQMTSTMAHFPTPKEPVPAPMPAAAVPPPPQPQSQSQPKPKPQAQAGAVALQMVPSMDEAPLEVERPHPGESSIEGVILPLVEKKSAWYVLFETSEFGPFGIDELKKVLDSPMFKAAPVLVWAEGMEDWCPAEVFTKLIGGKEQFADTAKVARSARLLASVICHVVQKGVRRDIEGDCEEIGNFGISVLCQERVACDEDTFLLDVIPLPQAGLDRFSVTVRLDKTPSQSKTQLLTYVNPSPSVKIRIDKYIAARGKSGSSD